MRHYLYKFSCNGYEGLAILTETQKDMALARIRREYKKGGEMSLESGETLDFDDLREALESFDFIEISLSEYKTLVKFFPGYVFGEAGPLDRDCFDFEEDDEEEEEDECENCGRPLDGEDSLCEQCEADEQDECEKEYGRQADKITDLIKKEYGIEASQTSDYHSKFNWKPTPKTMIEITIGEFDDGDEEIELTLFLNGIDLDYEFFEFEGFVNSTDGLTELRNTIKGFIEKAKKY